MEAQLAVPPEAEPTPVSFELRAREGVRGPQEINVVFFQDPEVLGQLHLIIKVVASAGGGIVTTTFQRARRPWNTPRVEPPEAVMVVNRTTHAGSDALHYSYEWVQQRWPPVEAGTVYLQSTTARWTSERYGVLNQFARRPPGTSPNEQVDALNRLGENLYRDVVPPAVRAFFTKFLPSGQSLLIYTNDPWIPWEIVKPWGDGLPAEHSDFLCARLAMARWYYSSEGQTPIAAVTARRLGAIISAANLRSVRDEQHYLENLPATWPPIELAPSPATPQDIVNLLSSGDVNIVHFATHGVPQSDGVDVAMLRIGSQEFSLDYLVGPRLEHSLHRATPLVMMNSCHSATRTPGLTRTDGWAERFLELGSAAFLGANWEVRDELAYHFARVLYDLLRQEEPIGRAVQRARAAIRHEAPANSTWLAYSLYAHPNAVVHAG
jgi:CHAT domain